MLSEQSQECGITQQKQTRMCNGWIKLHRKILKWEWFSCSATFHLFVYLLLTANTRWQGKVIKRGQLITSISSICKDTKLSTRQVRTSLERLKTTNEVTSETTNKYTLITICKYESYQAYDDNERQTERQAERQTKDKQKTNERQQLKNNKNIRNKEDNKKEKIVKEKVVAPIVATSTTESIESRKEKFYQSLVPYVEKYGREMVRAFYDYWTELTPGGRKMRVEQQRVFEISKRLATWKKNETKYETNHDRHGESSNAAKAERDAEFFAHIREKLSRPNTDAEDLPYALQDI